MTFERWMAILGILALIGGPAWAYFSTRGTSKISLYDSLYNQMQEDLTSLRAEMKDVRQRVKSVEDLAEHYDGEVRALRRGIIDGTIPPLPDRPAFRGAS